MKRIDYAGSVHDEEEIEAVVSVLRGGATALRIGKHTREMERLVAEAFRDDPRFLTSRDKAYKKVKQS